MCSNHTPELNFSNLCRDEGRGRRQGAKLVVGFVNVYETPVLILGVDARGNRGRHYNIDNSLPHLSTSILTYIPM